MAIDGEGWWWWWRERTPTTQDGLGADPSSSRGEPWLINQPRVGQTALHFAASSQIASV